MKFDEALAKAKKGAAIRLTYWPPDNIVRSRKHHIRAELKEPYLFLSNRHGCVPWIPTHGEYISDEWEVVEEVKV